MERDDSIEIKANKYRFLRVHILGGILGGLIVFIFFDKSFYGFLMIMSACLIVTIPILVISPKKYNVILKPDKFEGPIRTKTDFKRISVPYKIIDLSKSRRPSFLRNGFIFTKDGYRILLIALYFNMKQIDRVFEELRKRSGSPIKY